HPPPPAERAPLHEGWHHTYVYAIAEDGKSISGFEVHRPALGVYFGNVIKMRPLIPPSLANGRITNDAIRIRVVDRWRNVIYTSHDLGDAPLSLRLPIEEGHMKGLTVEASIDPYVAPLLVFGGIPRPLPIFTVTLVVIGLLLFTALM